MDFNVHRLAQGQAYSLCAPSMKLKRLHEEFMIENTNNSNAIEENTLTLRETAHVLQQGVTIEGKQVREYVKIIGHKDARIHVGVFSSFNSGLYKKKRQCVVLKSYPKNFYIHMFLSCSWREPEADNKRVLLEYGCNCYNMEY